MKSRQPVIAAAVLIGGMLSCPADAEDYLKSYAVAHRAEVRVHVDDGSVRVVTSDAKQVEFRVRYEGTGTQIGNQLHIDSRQNGDHIDLTEARDRGVTLGNRQVRTEVRMPRDADLLVEAQDGSVQVSSVNGKVTIHTKDGRIKVSQLSGRIDLHSADGEITADAPKGESTLSTEDGTVSVRNADGKLTVFTADGAIRADGRFDFLDLKTADGSVHAQIEQGSRMSSPWNIRTKDGSVDIAIPTAFAANVDIRSREGSVGVDPPLALQGSVGKTHIEGKLNGGGPLLSVRTEDGSARLTGL